MDDNNSKNISYSAGFLMLIGFALVGIVISSAAMVPIWKIMTGTNLADAKEALKDPANSSVIKVLQIVSEVVGFLIPTIIVAMILNRKPFRLLGFSGKINWEQVGLVIAIVLSAMFFAGTLAALNEKFPLSHSMKEMFDKMENDYNDQVKAIINLNSPLQYIIALIIMAFIPALCEETLFRGGLQNFLTRSTKNHWLSIIIVSILFSLAHLSFYGFLVRFFLGIVLGLIYHYSGKIWLNIFAHFINNGLAITVIYFYQSSGKSLDKAMSDSNVSSNWMVGLIGLPLLILFMRMFYKTSMKNKALQFSNENPTHGI